MTRIHIEVGEELFRFSSMQNWISKARGWFEAAGVSRHDHICIDQRGRVCRYGAHFIRARDDDSFPVVVYRLDPQEKNHETKQDDQTET